MRRITLAVVSTLAVLVLLFSYKTSRPAVVAAAPASAAAAARIVSGAPPAQNGSAAAAPPAVTGGVPPTQPAKPDPVTVPTQPAPSNGSTPTSPAPVPPSPAAPSVGPAPTRAATPAPTSKAPTSKAPAAAAPLVVDGAAVDTDYGPVQVRVTISGGRITDVSTPVYPQESGRDRRINTAAIPQLQSEALAAQGVHIDAVSGATYTTQGFVSSLQSALDAAHFGS